MIVLRIMMNALPEKRLEVMQTLLSMIGPAGKETGCLRYAAFCDIADTNSFCLIQEWHTRDDLNLHLSSPRFGVLLGAKTLLSEAPQVQIYAVSRSEGMEAVRAARAKII